MPTARSPGAASPRRRRRAVLGHTDGIQIVEPGTRPTRGPFLDATVGMAAGALLSAWFDPQFTFSVAGRAHLWLATLAVVSQVVGWLLIATALPRLPALATSVLLLTQPVFGYPSGACWSLTNASRRGINAGFAIVLAGVASLSMQRAAPAPSKIAAA